MTVLLPQYHSGHPDNYLYLLHTKKVTGSEYLRNIKVDYKNTVLVITLALETVKLSTPKH